MISRQITIADIVKLTGYTRHQIRKLLEALPVFNNTTNTERVARQFTMSELVAVVVFCELESVYGVRRTVLSTLSVEMLNTFKVPREISETARLIIDVRENKVLYKNTVIDIDDGIVIPLERIIKRIHDYLLGAFLTGQGIQQNLNLGPGTIKRNIKNTEKSIGSNQQDLPGDITECL